MVSFRVNKLAKTVVKAALPRQAADHRLPVSNLDLLIPYKMDVGVCFCYRKPPLHSFSSAVSVLKKALSQVLVPYYPVAGEMIRNAAGEPEILCNNRGVDFEEAYADVELRDLDLYKPEESVQGELLPVLNHGLLSAQITQLRCGGVVLGCTFDHRVADGYSANMFWKSWAEMARSQPLSSLPSFQRSLVSSRRPGTFDSSITDFCIPISKLPLFEKGPDDSTQPPPFTGRIYSISADQIRHLQLLANHENPDSLTLKRTKLEAFSAYLWKLIATGSRSCHLAIAIDGRTRIAADGALSNYFGNVVSYSSGKKKVVELEQMPLSSIANEIHQFFDFDTVKKHFLGLIDFVEAHRPVPVVFKMLVSKEESPMLVSSLLNFPIEKIDFGWGQPVFWSYFTQPSLPQCGMIVLPSPSQKGDWVIYAHITEDQVELIENTAGHVLKPFCLD